MKIVEKANIQLKRILVKSNPWAGSDCGRGQCYTCSQGSEVMEDCKRRNILYESYCMLCNPDLEDKKVMKKNWNLQHPSRRKNWMMGMKNP